MAVLSISIYPDPILKRKCEQVRYVGMNIRTLIDNMVKTMIAFDGVGLSAPQVGFPVRVIVFEDFDKMFNDVMALVNPQILSCEGNTKKKEEGCLSIPDTFAKVNRSEKIVVKGTDRNSKEIIFNADGIMSRVIQHEIDHLHGLVFWDRLETTEREKLKKKYSERYFC